MKKVLLNSIKYVSCKYLWVLIISQIFNFIPNPFIRYFIKKLFYKYIYLPAFNYVIDKISYFFNYMCHKIKEEYKYIVDRMW